MSLEVKHDGPSPKSNIASVIFYNPSGVNGTTSSVIKFPSVTNVYKRYSRIFSANSNPLADQHLKILDYDSSGLVKVSIRRLHLLDLDEIFGTGNTYNF